jgi:hypothetical protein
MKLSEIENRIQELKDICRDCEQRLMDDHYVDLHEYREALKELNWLRILRDSENYDEEDE